MQSHIATLAELIRQLVGSYSSVAGVPKGGLRLASALTLYILMGGPRLIVDDVLTTGASMEKMREQWLAEHPETKVIGAAIFARGPCPHWIKPLFQLSEELWIKPKTC